LIPNLVTSIRIVLVPIIFILLAKEASLIWIYVLIIIFALSDILDGYLARTLNQVSDLGKILDPLIDKTGIAVFLVYVVIFKNFPVWAMIAVIAKDVLILMGGMALIKTKKEIPTANLWGKVTLCVWSCVLFSYIFNIIPARQPLLIIGLIMLFLNLIYYAKRFVGVINVFPKKDPNSV
jgi:CDP-diacylglycerol--glycerol-3-phosphate 3-phosphatidyltransferase